MLLKVCPGLLILLAVNLQGFAQQYFQQKVDYRIEVALEDKDNSLSGFEKIHYTNQSGDTLKYIWFHLWPNAYKNDKTAFSEQLLQLHRTDVYFSNEEERGYINRLDFKVNGVTAILEDHPLYIDVAKLRLPDALPPGATIEITTPFHVKLPYNFSRGGYHKNTYQVTQWYPKPAVYDNTGWHPMPYLDQGEYYSEFGSYVVAITVPGNYIVAATGTLVDSSKSGTLADKDSVISQTLTYSQDSVHDFAWFADKNFIVRTDTCALPSGKVVTISTYNKQDDDEFWKEGTKYIKRTLRTRSAWIGEYPYSTAKAVEALMGVGGGMEYPTITSITSVSSVNDLESVIEHEVGHNWFYGILGSNERDHPWMDEGINSFYDARYDSLYKPPMPHSQKFLDSRLPNGDESSLLYRYLVEERLDQPIDTKSANFNELNYGAVAYYKTSVWLRQLENTLGRQLFDSCMHAYFTTWKFKHPAPEDFKKSFEATSHRPLSTVFEQLAHKGAISLQPKKAFKFKTFGSFRNSDKYYFLFGGPAIGYNKYDQLMVGVFAHNYTIPEPRFHFFLAPLLSTGAKNLAGIGRVGYSHKSYGLFRKIEISLSGEKFSKSSYTDSTGNKHSLGFEKVVPTLQVIFRNKSLLSHTIKKVTYKTFIVNETSLNFRRDTVRNIDIISYPKNREVIHQLSFSIVNNRELYPFQLLARGERGTDFGRISLSGNMFFNYPKSGGLHVRAFAGKFLYRGDRTLEKQYSTDRYQLNMTGPKGAEDYTYSNYFFGRNEYDGFAAQQIMVRDGAFKVRTDLLSQKIGKTDDWLAAVNLTTDVPKQINPLQVLPFRIPLKAFLDIGTYAEPWQDNSGTGRFLFDAGLQISVLSNLVNIYFPLFYSKVYSDYFKSTIPKNRFAKNISFSIDIHKINLPRILRNYFQ